jgi:hypothetical protein
MKSFLKGIRSVCVILAMFAAIVITSCGKDEPTEFKIVPSDISITINCWGYSIGSSRNIRIEDVYPDLRPQNIIDGKYVPVQGVVIMLENGKTFTSDSDGKINIKLKQGEYLYRVELPDPWRLGYDIKYDVYYDLGIITCIYTLWDSYSYRDDEWKWLDMYDFNLVDIMKLYRN